MSRQKAAKPAHPNFVACTVVGQTPLFARPEPAEIVLDVLRTLQRQGNLMIFGYVVLEDHVHLIASGDHLERTIDRFESSTQERLSALLHTDDFSPLARQLQHRGATAGPEGTYQLWLKRQAPQPILGREAMRQNLETLHANPVRRGYVTNATLWRYSSARDYAGQPGLLTVTTDW